MTTVVQVVQAITTVVATPPALPSMVVVAVAQGPQGATGATGATGPAGPGVPAGGDDGALLMKSGISAYATSWLTTTAFGRGLLAVLSAAALRLAIALPTTTTAGRLARYTDANGSQGETIGLFEDASGNVGIGTAAPTYGLTVTPNGGTAGQTAFFQDQTPTTGTTGVVIRLGASATGHPLQIQNNAGALLAGYDVANGRWFAPSLWLGSGGDGIWQSTQFHLRSDLRFAWSASTNASGTKDVGVSRGGVGRLHIGNGTAGDFTGTLIAGNIGIGTTTPQRPLDISVSGTGFGQGGYAGGTAAIFRSTASTGSNSRISITAGNAGVSIIDFGDTDGDRGSIQYIHNGDALAMTANGAERIRITSSGNVGIGTTSPTSKLDNAGDTYRQRTSRTPASATAAGNAGDICWDADFIYVCVATNTWRRSTLSTW